MPFRRNNSLKALALVRCDEYIRLGEKACQENSRLASRWGKVHISLVLVSVFFSTISTLLAFYNRPLFVAVMTFLAALSTGSLTFLNPTKRDGHLTGLELHSSPVSLKLEEKLRKATFCVLSTELKI